MPYRDRKGKITLSKREINTLNEKYKDMDEIFKKKLEDLKPLDDKDQNIIPLKKPEKRLIKEDKEFFDEIKEALKDTKYDVNIEFNVEGEKLISFRKKDRR